MEYNYTNGERFIPLPILFLPPLTNHDEKKSKRFHREDNYQFQICTAKCESHFEDMKGLRYIPVTILLLFGFTVAQAQQNFFNVPSSDITEKHKLFFQQQANFLVDGSLALNSTFCYGLGRQFEIGVNFLGVYMNTASLGVVETNDDAANSPVYPFFTVNLQKAFILNSTFKVGIGTQMGFSPGMHFGSFSYLNVVTAIPQIRAKVVTGINHGTDTFLGPGDLNPLFSSAYDPVGFQLGFEQEIIKEKLSILAEHISGTHSLGVSVLGLGYHLTQNWVISTGYQFSSSGNGTPNSLVFEFTFVPSAASARRIYYQGHPVVEF